MELYALDSNPIPDGAVVGSIEAVDRFRLRYARWPAVSQGSAQGTVCLFQGRAEMIEKYFETVCDLRRRGFVVATFDARGQGGSDRSIRNPRKSHIDDFAEFDRDFDAFMQQVVLPDCPPPYFALAHSTGGLVCLRAARDGRAGFKRLVLASPLIGLGQHGLSPAAICRFMAFFASIGLGELAPPQRTGSDVPFEGNTLTSDPVRFQRTIDIVVKLPQLAVGPPTIGWLHAACKAMHEAADPDFALAARAPILLIAGSRDSVISLTAVETLADALRAGAHVIVPGARHELLSERDSLREQFWAAFDAFIPGS